MLHRQLRRGWRRPVLRRACWRYLPRCRRGCQSARRFPCLISLATAERTLVCRRDIFGTDGVSSSWRRMSGEMYVSPMTARRHLVASSTPPRVSNPPSAGSGSTNSATEDGFWYNFRHENHCATLCIGVPSGDGGFSIGIA